MAGVTPPETRGEKAEDFFLYFNPWEAEVCKCEVVCPCVTQ